MTLIALIALIALLDVVPKVDTPPDQSVSLVVGLVLAIALLLWLASYLPARDGRRR